jgi:hypothetical protein
MYSMENLKVFAAWPDSPSFLPNPHASHFTLAVSLILISFLIPLGGGSFACTQPGVSVLRRLQYATYLRSDICSFPSWNNLEWNKKYECFALVLEDSRNLERRQNGSSKKNSVHIR